MAKNILFNVKIHFPGSESREIIHAITWKKDRKKRASLLG